METLNTREQSTDRDRRHAKIINALARDWADYVGGLAQAKKVVKEAFEAGLVASGDHDSTQSPST